MKRILNQVTLLLLCAAVMIITASCNNDSGPTVKVPPPVTSARHYHLKGKVVSIDKQSKMLNVDSEAIPDFMSAMTMPYKVKPEGELDQLHPGDAIAADLLVQDEDAWLENIVVTGHSPARERNK